MEMNWILWGLSFVLKLEFVISRDIIQSTRLKICYHQLYEA